MFKNKAKIEVCKTSEKNIVRPCAHSNLLINYQKEFLILYCTILFSIVLVYEFDFEFTCKF